MSQKERLLIPLAVAVTLMWLASGFAVLFDRSNTSALEVFLATMTLEGLIVGSVVGVNRLNRALDDEKSDGR